MRAIASSAFMPASSWQLPFRLPLQPPSTSTFRMVWSGSSSTRVCAEQVPWFLRMYSIFHFSFLQFPVSFPAAGGANLPRLLPCRKQRALFFALLCQRLNAADLVVGGGAGPHRA